MGGLYRIRYTGRSSVIPLALHARQTGMEIGFSGELNRSAAELAENYKVETWDLKRSRTYGSKHYNEKVLKISEARLSADGKRVVLTLPEIQPTWVMEITFDLRDASGKEVRGVIQNTIHALGNDTPL